MFSRSAFSRSVFSRSVFSRSGFSRSVFSRSGFSRSVFSRSGFSRSVFSRSGFSRSVFSRSGFSRSVFSRSGVWGLGFRGLCFRDTPFPFAIVKMLKETTLMHRATSRKLPDCTNAEIHRPSDQAVGSLPRF